MPEQNPPRAARLARYGNVSTRLALMSDQRIGEAVAAATPLGTGIGGRSAELSVAGTRVFVKRVPVTDVELRPENVRSTANVFGLPTFYQYGVGSAGFGAWRELAAHTMTTRWVLDDAYAGFPLMYHWRILPDTPPDGFTDEFGGLAGAVAHWEGSPAVRDRLEAIGGASFSLVLFLEHVPHTLAGWLAAHDGAPDGRAENGDGSHRPRLRPHSWVKEELARGAAFMSSRGLVHFDAHFANVLTDGRLLYFADLGLALSADFDLSPQESRFLTDHLAYDHCYTATFLLNHYLLDDVRGEADRDTFLREWIVDRRPDGIPPESKRTPFPAPEIERARRSTAPSNRRTP